MSEMTSLRVIIVPRTFTSIMTSGSCCSATRQTQLDLSRLPVRPAPPSHQQQMLLHRQMAYKANCTTLIPCVASIKNWIETDKIRLCLRDLRKCESLI